MDAEVVVSIHIRRDYLDPAELETQLADVLSMLPAAAVAFEIVGGIAPNGDAYPTTPLQFVK